MGTQPQGSATVDTYPAAHGQAAHPLPCELISWEAVYRLARRLALRIREAGLQPEVVVAIARGGVVPARILCDFLSVYELLTLRVAHYTKGAQKKPEACIVTPLAGDIGGRRVLLVDDVSDTGDTLRIAVEQLRRAAPAALKTVVLHHKRTATYTPDLFADEVSSWRWLIYPWAVIEDLSGFIEQMPARPVTPEAIVQRLQTDYGIEVAADTLEDLRILLGFG